MEGRVQIATQHLEGRLNDVADLLSFEGSDRGRTNPLTEDCPPNDILTSRILLHHPQLVPTDFRISNLPPGIASFACSAMQTIELYWTQSRRKGIGKSRGCGAGGLPSSPSLGTITPDSIAFPEKSESSFSSVSLSVSEEEGLTQRDCMLASVRGRWLRQLSKVPQATWLRRFGNVTGTAPCTSRDGPTAQGDW